ncbi:MAG: hypothetical protein R6V28_14780 [Nitriliruptoraceae bacterium]
MPSAVAAAALLVVGCTGDDGSSADDGIQAIEVEDDGSEPATEPGSEPDAEPEPEPEPDAEPEPGVAAESGSESESEQPAPGATEPDDPFAFDDPSEIDAEYVDRVMAELLAVNDELLDEVLRSDPAEGLTELDTLRIRAIFSGPRLVSQANSYQSRATDEEVRTAFLPESERQGTDWATARIMLAEESCVVAVGEFDISGIAVQPYPSDEFGMVVLSRMEGPEADDFGQVNPTQWRIHEQVQLVSAETGAPVAEADWESLNFREALDVPCAGE